MIIKILPSALQDLRDGWCFYEDQQIGLGDYFQDSLFSDVDSLHLYAGLHRVIFGYHRLFAKRFPYFIYYTMENPDSVLVWRILDSRQDPGKIEEKLNN